MQNASYWLNKHNNHNKQLNEQILNMINTIVKQNYFQCEGLIFQPAKDTAMGPPISSTIAEIYVQYLENAYIKHWLDSKEISFYKRYVDNILILYDQRKIDDQIILQKIKGVDKNLQFKMSTEINNVINYLDTLICRDSKGITIGLYRKPTKTGTVIHLTSNHPLEHKISAFLYYINRLTTLPITEGSKQKEWETVLTIARKNGYPVSMINNLKTKLINREKKQKQQQQQEKLTPRNKWITFTYFSLLVRQATNLFKQTRLKIAFRATNTIQQQLAGKQTHSDPSGIYKLKCNTCNKVYVGQSGRTIGIRFKEHIRYMRSNNSTSAYATHILENRHECGTKENTLQLLKACQKVTHMDWWEALYLQVFRQQKVLIDETQVNDTNSLFVLAKIPYTQ